MYTKLHQLKNDFQIRSVLTLKAKISCHSMTSEDASFTKRTKKGHGVEICPFSTSASVNLIGVQCFLLYNGGQSVVSARMLAASFNGAVRQSRQTSKGRPSAPILNIIELGTKNQNMESQIITQEHIDLLQHLCTCYAWSSILSIESVSGHLTSDILPPQ